MRRNLLASTALTTSTTVIAGAAWAADLPVKAPPPPAVIPFSWSGCYAGLNAGGASTSINQSVTLPGVVAFDSSGHDTSFTGGGQIGCNWQFDPHWVLGIEGDIDYLHANRSHSWAFSTSRFGGEDTFGSQKTSLRWFGTLRPRFGYVWNHALFYATGGLAFGNVVSSVSATVPEIPAVFSGSYSGTRVGWTVGGGIEYPITDRISAKLEYLYFDLGEASYNVMGIGLANGFPGVWTATAKTSGDIVRVGLNLKFFP